MPRRFSRSKKHNKLAKSAKASWAKRKLNALRFVNVVNHDTNHDCEDIPTNINPTNERHEDNQKNTDFIDATTCIKKNTSWCTKKYKGNSQKLPIQVAPEEPSPSEIEIITFSNTNRCTKKYGVSGKTFEEPHITSSNKYNITNHEVPIKVAPAPKEPPPNEKSVVWCVYVHDEKEEEYEGDTVTVQFPRRTLRDTADPFNVPEKQFVELYGLTKLVAKALCEDLRPHLQEGVRSTAMPLELKVLATLNFLVSGSDQKRLGQDFLSCMSQSSVSVSIRSVVTALNSVMEKWIRFPDTVSGVEAVKSDFWKGCRYPGVIGAVDRMQIDIWPKRKHCSLNFILVCDYNRKILAVNPRHGNNNTWNCSEFSLHFELQHCGGRTSAWLLGDSGYPLLPYLMVPKLNQPEGSPAAKFTSIHSRTRTVIEHCIRTLKGRWTCLEKLVYSPEFSAFIVNACCVLHNFAIFHNVPESKHHDDRKRKKRKTETVDAEATGHEVRESIICSHFT